MQVRIEAEWLQWLVYIGPVVVAALLTYRKLWKVIKPTVSGFVMLFFNPKRILDQMTVLNANLGNVNLKVDQLMSEMKPNGGSTMRDALNRMETELLTQGQFQRAVVSDAESGVMQLDKEGNCIWANRTFTRMMGRSLDEILGRGWVNTIAPAERDHVLLQWDAAVEEEREFESEYHAQAPSGDRFLISVKTVVLRDRHHRTLGYIKSVRRQLEE